MNDKVEKILENHLSPNLRRYGKLPTGTTEYQGKPHSG
jgi:hypothetical protein